MTGPEPDVTVLRLGDRDLETLDDALTLLWVRHPARRDDIRAALDAADGALSLDTAVFDLFDDFEDGAA